MDKHFISKTDSVDQKLRVIDTINTDLAKNGDIEITINYKRTSQQNKALHKYFSMVADALNEQGIEFTKVFKTADLMITPVIVKECMWKPLQQALFGKESTTELSKQQEIDKVYDVINRKLSESYGIYVPFPNKEE